MSTFLMTAFAAPAPLFETALVSVDEEVGASTLSDMIEEE